jgi:hypothetical protein
MDLAAHSSAIICIPRLNANQALHSKVFKIVPVKGI